MKNYNIKQYNAKRNKWVDMGTWDEKFKNEFIKGYSFDGEFYKRGNSATMYKITEVEG